MACIINASLGLYAVPASVNVLDPEAGFSLPVWQSSTMRATVYTEMKDDIDYARMNTYVQGTFYSYNNLYFSYSPATGMWEYSGSVAHPNLDDSSSGHVICEISVGGKIYYSPSVSGDWVNDAE